MSEFPMCPVCDRRWFEVPEHCACGYAVDARDPRPAIAQLTRKVRVSHRRFALGLGLLLAVPVTCFALLNWAPTMITVAVLALALELGFGSVLTITGITRGERDGKQLAAAKSLMLLPAARVVASPSAVGRVE